MTTRTTPGAATKDGSRVARERVVPEPVSVACFAADGAPRAARQFAAGPVSNYPNYVLLKEAVRHYQGNLRSGTASTKTRSEVNGGNHKPWKQKGTGRARAGTRKSPLWRGGGIIFGPRPRDYNYELPRKMRRLATRHALLSKLLDGETKIIEDLAVDRPNTAMLAELLTKIGVQASCLIGIASNVERRAIQNLTLSCQNLPKISVLPVSDFNALALLKNRALVLTSAAFAEVEAAEQAAAAAAKVGAAK
ncbi:MAG: 50S ribosomal protein L4 [Planctomycetota bacterium]